MRLEPNVHDALMALEAELRVTKPDFERNDVMRLLLDCYAKHSGNEQVQPDIDPADAIAQRTEVVQIPMSKRTREFFAGNAKANSWSYGATFEEIAHRSVKYDKCRQENIELCERINTAAGFQDANKTRQ